MNTETYDLVVVSVFGRGEWLAAECASRGWRVSLLDATGSLGHFDERDIEGPFGLLEASDLNPSQRASLVDEGEFANVPGGFTLWLPEGPLEFRSELTSFLLRARGIPPEVEAYLRHPGDKAKTALSERKFLRRLQYSHSWLAQFAHSFASAAHFENHLALASNVVASLFAPFGLRQLTAGGMARGFQNCQNAGVNVERDVQLRSFAFEDGNVVSFEHQTAKDETVNARARAFVWCLSFEETKKISDSLLRALFTADWPEAQWAWHRLSFSASESDVLSLIPFSSVIIDDIDLAWTRANMIVLRRRARESGAENPQTIDAWVKVPTWMRRETAAFEQVREEVRLHLEKKCPGLQLDDLGQDLTPLLWPMWSGAEFKIVQGSAAPRRRPNLFFDSPGIWTSLDWMGRFRHESAIVVKLEKLKTQWDMAARKAEAVSTRRKGKT